MQVSGVDTATRNLLTSKARGVAWLVEASFVEADLTTPAPLYWITWPENKTLGGKTYFGVGKLFEVGAVSESENISTEQISVSVTIVDSAMKALAIGQVERYRNRRIKLFLQAFNEKFQPVGAPVLRWSGFMDRVKIPRPRGTAREGVSGASQGRIEMECSRAGGPRLRQLDGYRLTSAQQKSEFPGDLGCDYINELLEKPTLWLTKKFQEI